MSKLILKPVVLIILDGWGISPLNYFNSIKDADPERFYYYWNNFPKTALKTYSGEYNNSKYSMPSLASGFFEENKSRLNILNSLTREKETLFNQVSNHDLRQIVVSDVLVSKELPMYLSSFDNQEIENCKYKFVDTDFDKKYDPETNNFKKYIDIAESEKTNLYDLALYYFPYLELMTENENSDKIIKHIDYVAGELVEYYLNQDSNIFITSSCSIIGNPVEKALSFQENNFVPFVNVNNHNKKSSFLPLHDFLPTIITSKYDISSIAPTVMHALGLPSKFESRNLNNIL